MSPANLKFKVTNCDLQSGIENWGYAASVRLHRSGVGHALLGAQQRPCRAEYTHHAWAFMRLREILATHKDLARAIEDIQRRQEEQGEQITAIIRYDQSAFAPRAVPEKRRIWL